MRVETVTDLDAATAGAGTHRARRPARAAQHAPARRPRRVPGRPRPPAPRRAHPHRAGPGGAPRAGRAARTHRAGVRAARRGARRTGRPRRRRVLHRRPGRGALLPDGHPERRGVAGRGPRPRAHGHRRRRRGPVHQRRPRRARERRPRDGRARRPPRPALVPAGAAAGRARAGARHAPSCCRRAGCGARCSCSSPGWRSRCGGGGASGAWSPRTCRWSSRPARPCGAGPGSTAAPGRATAPRPPCAPTRAATSPGVSVSRAVPGTAPSSTPPPARTGWPAGAVGALLAGPPPVRRRRAGGARGRARPPALRRPGRLRCDPRRPRTAGVIGWRRDRHGGDQR